MDVALLLERRVVHVRDSFRNSLPTDRRALLSERLEQAIGSDTVEHFFDSQWPKFQCNNVNDYRAVGYGT